MTVEASIQWNSNQMVAVEQTDVGKIDVGKRPSEIAEKRKCNSMDKTFAKLRRCSRMVNFIPYAEMIQQSRQLEISNRIFENNEDFKQPTSTVKASSSFPFTEHTKDDSFFKLAKEKTCNRRKSERSIASSKSMTSLPSFSESRSIRPSAHTVAELTVLLIDIQGFTAECAALPAGRVGEWVAAFYARVEKVAAKHGVSKVEVRGDCCICVAGADGAVPSRALVRDASADRRCDQATRMLAFAAALHSNLATLTAGSGGSAASTAARMGIATGEAAFLISDAADRGAAPFASLRGEAVDLAQRMEALARPGAVYVHRSTADKWAAECRRPPPASVRLDCGSGGGQRAAVYDCATGAFRSAGAGKGAARGGNRRRRGSWSC